MTIFKLSPDSYKLVSKAKTFTGNRAQVIAAMLLLKVQSDEIELGLTYLDNGMNRAEYGIGYSGLGPMFIFADKLAS